MEVFRKNKSIRSQVESIFGKNVIEQAYIGTFIGELSSEERKKKGWEILSKDFSFEENVLNFGGAECYSVAIKFKNGHLVIFDSSEWGSMTKADKINIS